MWKRLALPVAFVALACAPALAVDREVIVENQSNYVVHTLIAFPVDFLPNTNNLVSTPLQPQERRTIEIPDIYERCVFSFIADFRNQRYRKTLRALTERVPRTQRIDQVNLCTPGSEVVRIQRAEPPRRR